MVNHVWAEGINDLMPAGGFRCGVVPLRDGQEPGVFGGDGDADETERELASLDLAATVDPKWIDHVRLNFTLDAR